MTRSSTVPLKPFSVPKKPPNQSGRRSAGKGDKSPTTISSHLSLALRKTASKSVFVPIFISCILNTSDDDIGALVGDDVGALVGGDVITLDFDFGDDFGALVGGDVSALVGDDVGALVGDE